MRYKLEAYVQYMRRKLLVLMSQHAACLCVCVCVCVCMCVCFGERQLSPDGTDRRTTEEFILSMRIVYGRDLKSPDL